MFDYYNNEPLIINLIASNKTLTTNHYLKKLQNFTHDIFNKIFFIDLNISDFKDDSNTYILFEINGNLSAFNSTQIYINDRNQSNTEIFSNFYCNKQYYSNNKITISCNYSKPYQNTARFMLLLNEGNQINIKNVIPEKKEIPTDERSDGKKGDDEKNENKSLKYFYYIGIPIIVIVVGVIIVIIIIKCKKKKLSLDDSAKALDTELIPNNE